MKIFKSIILALTVFTAFLLSCQKELAFDSNGGDLQSALRMAR